MYNRWPCRCIRRTGLQRFGKKMLRTLWRVAYLVFFVLLWVPRFSERQRRSFQGMQLPEVDCWGHRFSGLAYKGLVSVSGTWCNLTQPVSRASASIMDKGWWQDVAIEPSVTAVPTISPTAPISSKRNVPQNNPPAKRQKIAYVHWVIWQN